MDVWLHVESRGPEEWEWALPTATRYASLSTVGLEGRVPATY